MAIEDTIQQAADKVMKAVEIYGPQASSLVLETGRISAIQQIITGITLAAAVYPIVKFWLAPSIARCRKSYRDDITDCSPLDVMLGCFLSGVAILICAIPALINLTNAFVWVGLFRPEVYLAAKLLKL